MNRGETKANTIKRVGKYVAHRVAGNNKQESALLADYAPHTARTPSLIESTKTYQEIIERVLTINAESMHILGDSLNNDIKNGVLEKLKPIEKAQIYKVITDINDKLTPKVTVKETQNKDGTISRVLWGTNGAPQTIKPE